MAVKTANTIQRERLKRRLLRHHLPLAVGVVATAILLFMTRPYRDVITRLSFATAYPALLLLAVTLWIGPWNVLRSRRTPLSTDLRRDIGIWAGIVGLTHAVIGQCVHLRGRPWLYYVYERGKHVVPLRHDPFGWANHTGLIGTLILLALLCTSNDLFLRKLGRQRWKKLQRWNYFCFALVALHTVLYQKGVEKLHGTFIFVTIFAIGITIFIQLAGVHRLRTRRSS